MDHTPLPAPEEDEVLAWVRALNATATELDRVGAANDDPNVNVDVLLLLNGYIRLAKAGPEGYAALCEELVSEKNKAALKRYKRAYFSQANSRKRMSNVR